MKVDFIIVGQGLAGTLLAFELLRLQRSFIVIHQPELKSASSVAAGIINPVIFKRMTKSWRIDEAFPVMESTYSALEELLDTQFYNRCRIIKILNQQGAKEWKEKVIVNHLEDYLEIEPSITFNHPTIKTPYGIGIVHKAGRLNIQHLISSFARYLEQKQLIRKGNFNFDNLEVNQQNIHYKDITAQKIIFCEGPAASANPYFGKVKFKHSKGEILEVHIPGLSINEIIQSEVFLMPIGNDLYKVGATYAWDDLEAESSLEAQRELIEKLYAFVSASAEIISQQAGIRPITHDRHPVIGFHPEYPSVGILNGLGSKGALTAPWLAKQMADHMVGISNQILPQIDVERYFKI